MEGAVSIIPRMMATTYGTEPSFRVGATRALYDVPDGYRIVTTGGGDNMGVSLDDQRFLMARVPGSDEAGTGMVVLVQNFLEELRRLVPN